MAYIDSEADPPKDAGLGLEKLGVSKRAQVAAAVEREREPAPG